MSLHSQLLRGLLALPVMLLLAIAGVIAPDATPTPTPSSLPAPELATAEAAARGEVPVMVDTALRASCPKRVARVQFAGR
jgi:hypothetical protein